MLVTLYKWRLLCIRRAADVVCRAAEDLVLVWFVYILLCTQRMVLGAVHVNPSPGLGGLRIALTIVALVVYLVATRQNHIKVGAWHKGAITAVVRM